MQKMGFHTGCLGSSVSKDDVRGFAYNEDQNCVGDFSGEMEGNPVILRKLDLTQIIDFFGSEIEPQSVTEDT